MLPLNLYIYFLLPLALLFASPGWANNSLQLTAPESANAGFYQLQWNLPESVHFFQLLESQDPSFVRPHILYRGLDTASHITGRANGDYYYRVIAFTNDGSTLISNDVKVSVQHHSLTRAFVFFAIGAVVFLSILITILMGNRRQD